MRVKRGAKWVTLFRYEDNKLRVSYEPLRKYEIHNLLQKGWREIDEMPSVQDESLNYK